MLVGCSLLLSLGLDLVSLGQLCTLLQRLLVLDRWTYHLVGIQSLQLEKLLVGLDSVELWDFIDQILHLVLRVLEQFDEV